MISPPGSSDDAEFLCAGTLIRLVDAGWDVHIATATPGDCGAIPLAAEEIATIRRGEATTAAESIGAEYHCLKECDVNVLFDKAINCKSIDLFRRLAPTLVFSHPRYDLMPDDEQVHHLARNATFSCCIPSASTLPIAAGSAVLWLYYRDPFGGVNPYTGEVISPTIWVNVSTNIRRKSEALSFHTSQREWLFAHDGVDDCIESMMRHAAMRGQMIGVAYAEAFVQHRGHPYPQSDLLYQLFGGSLGDSS